MRHANGTATKRRRPAPSPDPDTAPAGAWLAPAVEPWEQVQARFVLTLLRMNSFVGIPAPVTVRLKADGRLELWPPANVDETLIALVKKHAAGLKAVLSLKKT